MTYAELVDEVSGMMNRDDLTDTQIKRFIKQSITLCARVLRLPCMEVQESYTITGGVDYVTIPGDYLELKHMSADDDLLDFMDFNHLNALTKYAGTPIYFSRIVGKWVFSPQPPNGTVINTIYYAEPATLAADGDTNNLTSAAEDAIIYGALVKACEFVVDERMPVFEAAFQREVKALNDQANRTDYTGGVSAVRPVTTNY